MSNSSGTSAAVPENRGKVKVEEETLGLFEWEKIVNKRYRKGQVEYLVKWKDFPSSANTWEPRKHLEGCADFIEDYEAKHASKGKGRKKRKSSSTISFTSPNPNSNSVPDSSSGTSYCPDSMAPDSVAMDECAAEINPGLGRTRVNDVSISNKEEPHNKKSKSEPKQEGEVSEVAWEQIVAVVGVNRIPKSGELFYKVVSETVENSSRNICSVPAKIARNRIPHLIIAFLSSVIKWVPKGSGTKVRENNGRVN